MVDCLDNPCHKTISTGRYDLHEQSDKITGWLVSITVKFNKVKMMFNVHGIVSLHN
jgi:major membrane immunogen (membrane-anchored lipoprotein)